MDRSISGFLRTVFLVHMMVSLILGATLWLIPGRILSMLGWVPDVVRIPEADLVLPGTEFVDPVLTRILGAALLALAYSSFRGWRAQRWEQVALVVESEVVLCVTGVVGGLAGIFLEKVREITPIMWVTVAILAVFALLWSWALRKG